MILPYLFSSTALSEPSSLVIEALVRIACVEAVIHIRLLERQPVNPGLKLKPLQGIQWSEPC